MSFEAGTASGLALLSEFSLNGTLTNPTSTGSSTPVSLVSGEDGYRSASSSSSAHESRNAKKSKIALDSSQPLTAKGKPRRRVYVACREWYVAIPINSSQRYAYSLCRSRSRKVRCDGATPACYNCQRRLPGVHACDYDAAPKRRGHDKVPGSRMRFAGEDGALRSSQPQQGVPVDGADSQFQQQRANLASTKSRWRHVNPPLMNFEVSDKYVHEFAVLTSTAPRIFSTALIQPRSTLRHQQPTDCHLRLSPSRRTKMRTAEWNSSQNPACNSPARHGGTLWSRGTHLKMADMTFGTLC